VVAPRSVATDQATDRGFASTPTDLLWIHDAIQECGAQTDATPYHLGTVLQESLHFCIGCYPCRKTPRRSPGEHRSVLSGSS
jgi:hypothetical protein